MRSMKRVLSLLLVLAMVFAMVPSFAMATESGNVSLNDGNITENGLYETGGEKLSLFTARNITNAVGFTLADGTETLYYVGTEEGQYTTTELALGAALKAWSEVKDGTVTLYADVNVTDRELGGSGVSAGNFVINVNGDNERLTVDLNGHTINFGDGTTTPVSAVNGNPALFSIAAKNTSLTVKNGTVNWAGSRAFFRNGSSSNTDDATKTQNSVATFTNLTVNYDGSTAIFQFNGGPNSKIVVNGGTYKHTGTNAGVLMNSTNDTSKTTFHVTGGAEFWSKGESPFQISSVAHVYMDSAKVYCGNAAGANGAYFVKAYVGGAVSTNLTLGNGVDVESECTNGIIGLTFDGATVYENSIDALVEGAEKVAGVLNEQGIETAYYIKEDLQAAEGRYYPTVAQAYAAAFAAANAAGTATMVLYKDFETAVTTGVTAQSLTIMPNGKSVSGTADALFTVANGSELILDGGVYNLAGGLVAAPVSGASYKLTLKNDVELNTSAAYAAKVGASGTLYLDECVVYTADNANGTTDLGLGIIAPGEGTVVLGLPNGDRITPDGRLNKDSKTYNGTTVYKKAFTTKYEDVKAAGFTPAGGEETLYYYNEGMTSADTDKNIYPSMDDAVYAAVTAANTAGVDATVTLYADWAVARTLAAGSTTCMQITTESVFTLDLGGHAVTRAGLADNGTIPSFTSVSGNKHLVIKNGTLTWDPTDRPCFAISTSTENSFSGSITLKDLHYINDGGDEPMFSANGMEGSITLDGGQYDMGATYVMSVSAPNGDKPGNVMSETTLTLTGGVEINCTKGYMALRGYESKTYIHDAVIYTAGNDQTALEGGYNVIRVCASETSASSSTAVNTDTHTRLILGLADGTTSKVSGTVHGNTKTYEGVTVYEKKFVPTDSGEGGEGGEGTTPSGPDYVAGVDVAGFKGIAADAVETIYGVVLNETDSKYYVYNYTAGNERAVDNSGNNSVEAAIESAFESATAAWLAAKKGTVTLYADVTTDVQRNMTTANSFELVLNLNGKTLREKANSTVSHFVQIAQNGNSITVNGGIGGAGTGKIIWDENFVGLAVNGASATFNGVTLDCGDTTAIQIKAKNTGSVTFNGGSVTASNLFEVSNFSGSPTVILQNGFAFTSSTNDEYAVLMPAAATLKVGEATFTLGSAASTAADKYIVRTKTGANAAAADGTVTKTSATLMHIATASGSKYIHKFVDENSMVAEFNGTKYLTLDEAIAALMANEGGTVKLLKDASLTTTGNFAIDVDFGFTLDLNGKTLTTSGNAIGLFSGLNEDEHAILPAVKKEMKIISSAATVGKIVAGDLYAAYNPYGDITVENVEFVVDESKIGAYYIDAAGKSLAFRTVDEAIARLEAKQGGTVKLMQDAAVSANGFAINMDCGFTLDLNGKTLTTSGSAVSVFGGLTAEEYAQLSEEQKTVTITSTANTRGKIVAGGVYGVYTAFGEATVTNVDIVVNGVTAFTYVSGDGTKTLNAAHLAEVFDALEADNSATNTQPGIINQLADYVVDAATPKMASDAYVKDVTRGFVWDMNGHSVKTADGYTTSAALMLNTVSAANDADGHVGLIKNGSISWKSSVRMFTIGVNNGDTIGELTFENVNLYQDGESVMNVASSGSVVTFDGGSVITYTANNANQPLMAHNKGGVYYLKGGVLVEKHGQHGYPFGFNAGGRVMFYVQDAVLQTYATYPCSSGYVNEVIALLDANGNVIDFTANGIMSYFTKVTITPSVFTDEGYTASYTRLIYGAGSVGDVTNDNAIVKSQKTGLVYTAENLQKYINMGTCSGDTLTVLKSFPSGNEALSELQLRMPITIDLAGFEVTADIDSTSDLTLKNGTVTGAVSAATLTMDTVAVNGAVAATDVNATNSSVNGAVTVNGGILNIENTNITSTGAAFTLVDAPYSHYIDGGKIVTGAPFVVCTGATLFVTGGTEITASGSNAIAEIGGAMLLKEAKVTFKNGVTPFDEGKVEGYREPGSDVVGATETIWTYVLKGNTDKTGMKAQLVETGMYFATVKEAIDAASNLAAETVKLIADDNIGTYTVDKDINLDLNKFTLTGNITMSSYNVILTNGTLAAASGDAYTVNGGTLQVENATIVSNGNAVVVDGATANLFVSNSSLYGNTGKDAVSYALNVKNASTVDLTNAVLASAAAMPAICLADSVPYGAVALNSGSVLIAPNLQTSSGDWEWAVNKDNIASVISSVSRYPENHMIGNAASGENSNNSYYVLSVTAPAATIGKTGYATLYDAVTAAKQTTGATIVLQRDCDLDDAGQVLYINKSMTIDLNGYTLDGTANSSYHQIAGGSVTIKNGKITNLESSANYTFMVGNGAALYLDNVDAYVAKAFVSTSTTTSTAYVEINGGTLVSKKPPVGVVVANSPGVGKERELNPVMVLTGGVKIIRENDGTPMNGMYTRYQIDDAYIYYAGDGITDGLVYEYNTTVPTKLEGDYGPIENGHFASANVKVETLTDTYNGKTYNVSHFYTGDVAYVDSNTNTFSSLDEALKAAGDNAGANNVYLMPGAKIIGETTLASNDTLVLGDNDLVFSTTGKLSVEGTLKLGTGDIVSNGNLVFKSGSKVENDNGQYAFGAEKTVRTDLDLQKVSLTLNDKVDMNLKFGFSGITGIIGKPNVTANGVAVPVDATNTDFYVLADIVANDYDDIYWVFAEAATKDCTFIGMPKAVSVESYACAVIAKNGLSDNLSNAMAGLMWYANVFTDPGDAPDAQAGDFVITYTDVATDGGEISVANDLTNGFGMVFTVNVATAGKLTVSHKDIYGTEFTETFDVTNVDNVKTYTKIHVADYDQLVTATLTVDGVETAKLETSLGAAIGADDNAIIASGLARKYFGK